MKSRVIKQIRIHLGIQRKERNTPIHFMTEKFREKVLGPP